MQHYILVKIHKSFKWTYWLSLALFIPVTLFMGLFLGFSVVMTLGSFDWSQYKGVIKEACKYWELWIVFIMILIAELLVSSGFWNFIYLRRVLNVKFHYVSCKELKHSGNPFLMAKDINRKNRYYEWFYILTFIGNFLLLVWQTIPSFGVNYNDNAIIVSIVLIAIVTGISMLNGWLSEYMIKNAESRENMIEYFVKISSVRNKK